MKHLVILFSCILVAACAGTQTKPGVYNQSFVIAGGQTVTAPTTLSGPIGAENDNVKILVAGFGITPSNENEKRAVLLWGFDFATKSGALPESVKVEEVSPSQTPVILIEDLSPKLKDGIWSGTAKPIQANSDSTPWLFSKANSVYVFRFTIKFPGQPASILYQPACFSGAAKQVFQRMIDRIERR